MYSRRRVAPRTNRRRGVWLAGIVAVAAAVLAIPTGAQAWTAGTTNTGTLVVQNDVPGDGGPGGARPRRRGDPRRGHGLEIVGAVARDHGGRLLIDRSPAGTEAVLELPTMTAHATGARMPAA